MDKRRLALFPVLTGAFFALFLILSAGTPVFAQGGRVLMSEPIALRNDYGYELIGRMKDRILLFRDKYDEFEVQAFDNSMRMSWSRKLEDIDKNGTQILAVIGGKNDFSVVFKQRRRGITTLHLHKYDAGANRIDSTTIKHYGERMFSPPAIDVIQSEDRTCIVATNTAERARMETVCFRLDKMAVLWDKVVQLDDVYHDSNIRAMTVSNAGDFFMVTELNNRRNRLDAHEYQILHLQAVADRAVRVPMPEFMTNDARFVYDNLNRSLVGAGFYADKNRERSNGVFYVRVPQTGQPTLRYETFSDKVISILRGKDVEEDNKGVNYANVQQIILRQDGGALLVAERYHEIQRGTSAARGFWRDGMRLVMDYYYDDLLLVAIGPDGTPHWTTILHKKQYSQDDDATFSSFFLMRSPDRLHLLFNDEIKYENTCSEYIVNAVGDFDRNSLTNTFGQNLRLRFRDALQLNANECLVPSEFRNKLRLVLLKF
ncbi:MAG: hypothetical protein IPM98_22445 [Lewinellaceae bacterium]|nr:hypothetical protein [Lewinellaceae bacterium]